MTGPRPGPGDPIAEARRQWVAHGWGDVADGMAAVTSVMRAHQIMLARVHEVLRPFGLTFARYELLVLLHFTRGGELSMSRASSLLQVHPTSVTNAVDRLAEAGLAARRADPSDGRGVLVEITEAGRELALAATERLNAEVFARPGLDDADARRLFDVVAALRRDAGDLD